MSSTGHSLVWELEFTVDTCKWAILYKDLVPTLSLAPPHLNAVPRSQSSQPIPIGRKQRSAVVCDKGERSGPGTGRGCAGYSEEPNPELLCQEGRAQNLLLLRPNEN